MRDDGIAIVVLLTFALHVSCLAASNQTHQPSHISSPISHISSPTSHISSPISHISSPTSHISYLISHISVTNHAGRVVSGEFGGVTNNTFIVSGRAYPLSVLIKSEILRVKKLAGCDVRTAKEKRLDRAREMRLERIRLREQEGEIDKETADRLRRELATGEGER